MVLQKVFELNYKKLGLLPIDEESLSKINNDAQFKALIKILYLPKGYTLTIDFNHYTTSQDSLFFVNTNQFLQIQKAGNEKGYFIFYNRDFYCIQIHDEEVACDGLLFNNIYNMPMTVLNDADKQLIQNLFLQINEELDLKDSSEEEMIRTCLKQILLRAARAWKKQQLGQEMLAQDSEMEFFRHFSRLVEIHYKEKHTVADYADLLYLAPKTITHKFKKLGLSQPNDIIKDRIILEAKRLIIHTNKTSKEIAYQLGYEDPAYFNRLFTLKTGDSPGSFRKKYSGNN
ncbi:AraC family transcriptional regulator [Flavobacterium piscis]|uniref:AraC-like DNA-binding protein n=1 Tax=Flavobacterium piscis TaxID=1114874 RepID=A0ABU1Y7X1_9FLAO|nr:AraC family transcriptional regulator [Flavobacterium piscis]MDR7210309.1 AraC-like DNA-binding protein [Flavobacterium piscis]